MSKILKSFHLTYIHLFSFIISLFTVYVSFLVLNISFSTWFFIPYFIVVCLLTFCMGRSLDLFQKYELRVFIHSGVFSFLFSSALILSLCFIYTYVNYETTKEIRDFKLIYIFYFILLVFSVFFIVINIVDLILMHPLNLSKRDERIVYFIVPFIFIALCYFPYFLQCFPGSTSNDSSMSLRQIIGTSPFSNHHPVMFTLFVGLFIKIGSIFTSDITLGIALYSVTQMLIVSAITAYLIYWLSKKNVSKVILIVVTLYFALNPICAYYSITMWKDIIFNYLLLLLSLFVFDIVISKGEYFKSVKSNISFLVLGVLICLFRNNGIFIIAFLGIALCIYFRHELYKYLIIFLSIILIFVLVAGPVYNLCGIEKSETTESLSIPLQQIAATYNEGGNISQSEDGFLNQIIPRESWKSKDDRMLSDSIKFDPDISYSFLEKHLPQFFLTWLTLGLKNPGIYLKAWIGQTFGFYTPKSTSWVYFRAAIDIEEFGINRQNFIYNIFGAEANSILYDTASYITGQISISTYVWFGFFFITIMIIKKQKKLLIPALPAFGTLFTLLIATPVACEFRYAYIFVLMLPLFIIGYFLNLKKSTNKSYKYSNLEIKSDDLSINDTI